MLQVSILHLFQQMLSDRTFRIHPGSSEALGFAATIVRRVFDKLMPRMDESAPLTAETGDRMCPAVGKGKVLHALPVLKTWSVQGKRMNTTMLLTQRQTSRGLSRSRQ